MGKLGIINLLLLHLVLSANISILIILNFTVNLHLLHQRVSFNQHRQQGSEQILTLKVHQLISAQ